MSDISGNKVDYVIVGQSSRSDARGGRSLKEMESEIAELQHEFQAVTARKRQIQDDLGALKLRLKSTLPFPEYANLMERRNKLLLDLSASEKEIAERNKRLRQLHQDLPKYDRTNRIEREFEELQQAFKEYRLSVNAELRTLKSRLSSVERLVGGVAL